MQSSTSSQKAELANIGKELYVFNFDNSKKSYLLMRESMLEMDREIQTILDKTKLYTLKIPVEVKVSIDAYVAHASTRTQSRLSTHSIMCLLHNHTS